MAPNMGAAAAKLAKDNQKRMAENKEEKAEVADFVGDGEVGPNKIRTRILNSFGERDLNMGIMRSLFRLLDDDGSGELSASEIRRGMVLMKFDDIEDPIALSKLLVDIDDDQTGTITEKEFLSFYAQHSRESLKTHLHQYVCSTVFMRATYYGVDKSGHKYATSEIIETGDTLKGKLASLEGWVAANNLPGSEAKLWLDIVGYEKDTFIRLSDIVGLDRSVMNDALVFQSPAISSVKGTNKKEVGSQTVVHKMSMSVDTLRERPADLPEPLQTLKKVFLRVTDVSSLPEYLATKALGPKEIVSDAAISLEQSSILCVGNNIVISLRTPGGELGKAEAAAEAKAEHGKNQPGLRRRTSIYAAGSIPSSDHEFAHDVSGVRSCFNSIHRMFLDHATTNDQHFLFDESAKSLSVHLLASILNENYSVRDSLQDWEEVLEADIRTTVNSRHVVHLDAIDNVTKSYKRILGPLAESLNPMNEDSAWYQVPGDSTPPEGDTKDEGGSENGDKMGGEVDEPPFTFLLDYYVDHISDFSELAGDINTVVANMDDKVKRIDELGQLLVNLKSDMMNRTMYALTLITTYTMVMGFYTGLFGMNFTNIYELPGPEDPDYAGFGYAFFWYILGSSLVSLYFYMYKNGLFDALF